MIAIESLAFNKLTINYNIKPFDCGDADLNGFLFDDAKNYLSELMAVTYLIEYEKQTAAYFCLLNDKVVFDTSDVKEKSFWNRFNRQNRIPNPKRRQNYPAVKIGRLAVNEEFGGQGIGRFILDTIKNLMLEKNDFDFLSDDDNGEKTRLMYFDLKSLCL